MRVLDKAAVALGLLALAGCQIPTVVPTGASGPAGLYGDPIADLPLHGPGLIVIGPTNAEILAHREAALAAMGQSGPVVTQRDLDHIARQRAMQGEDDAISRYYSDPNNFRAPALPSMNFRACMPGGGVTICQGF